MAGIQKTNPHFWFSNNAEEAVGLTRVFSTTQRQAAFSRYTKEGFDVHHVPEGTVMSIGFTIEGQGFLALNGGPIFNFGGAISSRSTAMTKRNRSLLGKIIRRRAKKCTTMWMAEVIKTKRMRL